MEVFSEEWARSWCLALNGDPAFRAAGGNWVGDVAVVMTKSTAGDSPMRAVRVDIRHGECVTAEPIRESEIEQAGFVLTATGAVWREVLAGRQNPLVALMTGKLRLTKGSLADLLPYGTMARELIRLALEMEAAIPEGWG